jgi:hypothetical protein
MAAGWMVVEPRLSPNAFGRASDAAADHRDGLLSSDAPVMCFVIALHSFVVRSALDSTVGQNIFGAGIEHGSYKCDGIPIGLADQGYGACTRSG